MSAASFPALEGCKNARADGPVIAFDDASLLAPDRIHPKVCEGKSNGKRFSVVGYAHWASGTVAHLDGNGGGVAHLALYPENDADGAGVGKAYVPVNVPIDGLFKFGVEIPEVDHAATSSKTFGRSTTEETTGTIRDETMRLHLVDGTVTNHTTKIRVTLEVEGNDGWCNLNFVAAAREP